MTEWVKYVSIIYNNLLFMSLIIGLIGQKLSGKDTVANYLVNRYGAVSIASSQLLDETLQVLGLPKSRENETSLAVALRTAFGENILNSANLNRLRNINPKIGLVNGIRRPQELIQSKQEHVRTIYISAPAEVRYERYQFRQEKKDDGVLSFEDFLRQDTESPTEKDIVTIGEQAEFRINNNSDLQTLYTEIDRIIEQLLA